MTPSEFFNALSSSTMNIVDEFYTPDAEFVDPMGRLKGSDKIKAYYAHQYQAVDEISWTLEPELIVDNQRVLFWKMHLKTKNLNSGQLFTVSGSSRFKVNEQARVYYHEDYFDTGAFIYEQLPILKHLHSFIKSRLSAGVEHSH